MIEEYYDAGEDHACLDLGLEKEAYAAAAWQAAKALGPKILPHLTKAWTASKAVAPAATKAAPTTMLGRAWQATGGRAGTAIGKGWRATGGRAWETGKQFAAPAGEAIESGVASGVGKVLGAPGKQMASSLVKGVPGAAAKDAVIWGGLQGLGEGAYGAYAAEEGERLKGFAEGAGSGALHGAAFGGAMGGFGKAMKNLRRGSLQQAAKRQLAKPMMPVRPKGFVGPMQPLEGPRQSAANLAQRQLDRGFFGSIGDVFTGKGPINRASSAQNVLGGLGQYSAEWAAPLAVLPVAWGGSEGNYMTMGMDPSEIAGMFRGAPPQPPAQASQRGNIAVPPPKVANAPAAAEPTNTEAHIAKAKQLAATLGGGAATGIPTSLAIDALSDKLWYPKGMKGRLLGHTGRALGSTAGVLGGHLLGAKLFPSPPPTESEVEQKLDQIDFDKLMRYYKKRDADQV